MPVLLWDFYSKMENKSVRKREFKRSTTWHGMPVSTLSRKVSLEAEVLNSIEVFHVPLFSGMIDVTILYPIDYCVPNNIQNSSNILMYQENKDSN